MPMLVSELFRSLQRCWQMVIKRILQHNVIFVNVAAPVISRNFGVLIIQHVF